MTLLLRLLGTLLLLLAGMGGGFAAAARAENSRRQLHSFARLLTYLAELLDAQALTGHSGRSAALVDGCSDRPIANPTNTSSDHQRTLVMAG